MNKSLWLQVLALTLVLLQVSGCSTLIGRVNNEEEVFFESNVQDVEVICAGRHVKTPGAVSLMVSKSHTCSAEKEGYQKKIIQIASGPTWSGFALSTALNTAAWGWWTMGIGTAVGWLVDFVSGAMKGLKIKNVYFQMEPASTKETNK